MRIKSPHERLFQYAQPYKTGTLGPTLEDLQQIPVDPRFVRDLLAALDSSDPVDQRVGLFFCEGLLSGENPHSMLVEAVVSRAKRLIESESDLLRASAVPSFIILRRHFTNYRERMLRLLRDAAPSVRGAALCSSETFLNAGEIKPLLSFERDDFISETERTSGPLRYILRDEALMRIEKSVDRAFCTYETSEARGESIIFWWDWEPFLSWWRCQR